MVNFAFVLARVLAQVLALMLALPNAGFASGKGTSDGNATRVPKVNLVKKKATTKTVAYTCKGKKTVKVTYEVSARGLPTAAKVTLDKKVQQLKTVGKSNRYTVNFGHGEYALSLDKSKLPVAKAPIMIFKTVPAKDIKAEPHSTTKGTNKAKVSAKAKATLAGLKNGTRILYSGCRPKP